MLEEASTLFTAVWIVEELGKAFPQVAQVGTTATRAPSRAARVIVSYMLYARAAQKTPINKVSRSGITNAISTNSAPHSPHRLKLRRQPGRLSVLIWIHPLPYEYAQTAWLPSQFETVRRVWSGVGGDGVRNAAPADFVDRGLLGGAGI